MDKFLVLFVIILCVTNTTCSNADGLNTTRNLVANENQYPYMVSLQELSGIHSNTRGHICAGVLVTLQHALTAAVCILEYDNDVRQFVPINRDEYRVFAGSVLLTNDLSADRVRRIANTTAHPEHNFTISRDLNNIGVIILGTPFSTNTVAPLAVRDIGTTDQVQCINIGWARSTQLMYAAMLAPDVTICSRLVDLLPNTMCGFPNFNVGCPGDQGSPLVCYDSLVGILVSVNSCSMPQLLIRVSSYTTWINSIVALPIPELGPEPSTVPPPTTTTTTTTPAPGSASSFQPGMALLAVIAVVQIMTVNVLNFSDS